MLAGAGVFGVTLQLSTVGIGLGLLGALWVTRLLASFLFGVASWDPATYASAALTLLGLTLLAVYLPARRAAQVDPVRVLREE
jgi:ABC-type antimicrobial peptide transport system permease subunit